MFDFQKKKKKQSWGFRADGDSEGFKRFHLFLRSMKPVSIHGILGPHFNSCSLFQFLSIIKLVVLVRLNTQLLSGYLSRSLSISICMLHHFNDVQRCIPLALTVCSKVFKSQKGNKNKASTRITKNSFKNSVVFFL